MIECVFNSTKYTSWYYAIINRARSRILDTYTETHHIIPRCLGGTDDKENLCHIWWNVLQT